jgi:hypothetical protein
VSYLKSKNVPENDIEMINDEINNKFQEISKLSKKNRTDITWKVLKSNKVGKITRKLVNSIYE